MTPHYHYWLLEALDDGRLAYVFHPETYQSKATCNRHATVTGQRHIVLMCREAHKVNQERSC